MRDKIGLIGTELLFPHILQAADGLDCDITPLEYRRMSDLPELYRNQRDQFDGFVITGNIAKEVVLRCRGDDDKPLHSISGLSVEYYQEFFRLINEDRSIDFSRVKLDSSLWLPGRGPQSVAEFLQQRLPIEKMQVKVARDLPLDQLERADQIILDNARRALDRGEMDLVVCRFSTAYQVLQQAGIPCTFVYPDPDNIVDTLTLLLQDIKLDRLNGSLPAVIFLSAPSLRDDPISDVSADSVGVQKCLLEFDQEYTAGFLIKRAAGGFEIYTTQQAVRRITRGFSNCPLHKYIYSRLGLEIHVGYGIGRDVMRARSNAVDACAASRRDDHSYAVLQDGNLVGPLDLPGAPATGGDALPQAAKIAELAGLSSSTIQRIASVSRLLGSPELTTQELANAMQVTVANANRFLNALVKSGQAHIAIEKRSASKGRPRKVYHLDFLERKGETR